MVLKRAVIQPGVVIGPFSEPSFGGTPSVGRWARLQDLTLMSNKSWEGADPGGQPKLFSAYASSPANKVQITWNDGTHETPVDHDHPWWVWQGLTLAAGLMGSAEPSCRNAPEHALCPQPHHRHSSHVPLLLLSRFFLQSCVDVGVHCIVDCGLPLGRWQVAILPLPPNCKCNACLLLGLKTPSLTLQPFVS